MCVLGSGSRGNCTYVAVDGTAILIDAGLSGRETARRLAEIGVAPESLSAVCVSHEHDDHRSALGVLQRRYGLDLYANAATIQPIESDVRCRDLRWRVFANGAPFQVGGLEVEPFSVPHDSYDPVGFILRAGACRVAVVTDMGTPTELIRARLRGCRAVILESNHDEELLREAARPWSLKQRIAGRQGHLSNRQAADLLVEVAAHGLEAVWLAHLSADCNRPELAVATVAETLGQAGYGHVRVELTYPDRPALMAELD